MSSYQSRSAHRTSDATPIYLKWDSWWTFSRGLFSLSLVRDLDVCRPIKCKIKDVPFDQGVQNCPLYLVANDDALPNLTRIHCTEPITTSSLIISTKNETNRSQILSTGGRMLKLCTPNCPKWLRDVVGVPTTGASRERVFSLRILELFYCV